MAGKPTDWEKHNLTNTFEYFTKIDLINREVAALMGDIDPENPGGLPGGLRSRLPISEKVLDHARKKLGKDSFEDFIFYLLVQQAMERLDAMIAEHTRRMKELLEEIAKANETLEQLDRDHAALEAEQEYFQTNGLFDLDENGCLHDHTAEEILKRWEAKTGQTIDRSDPATYSTMFDILMEIETQRLSLRHNIDAWSAEYEWREQQRDQAIILREQLANGDLAAQQHALSMVNDVFVSYEPCVKEQQPSIATDRNPTLNLDEDTEIPSNSDAFRMNFPPMEQSETLKNTVNVPTTIAVIR